MNEGLSPGLWLIFRYNDGENIRVQYLDMGIVSSLSNSYSPRNTSSIIPTQPSQNRFVMNTGVKRSMSIDFFRINPTESEDSLTEGADSRKWSNGFWAYIVKTFLVNRWQGETDGCKMVYISPNPELYPSIGETNCYISEFNPKQSIGITQALSGTLKLSVGATNISKVSAKHTIVYHSNYTGHKSTFQGAESNLVKVTDNENAVAQSIPSSWLDTAFEEGIIDDKLSALNNSYWSTVQSGEGGSTYPQRESLELSEQTKVLMLYARYREEPL